MADRVSVFDSLIVRGRAAFKMFGSPATSGDGVPDGALRLYHDDTNQYIQTYSHATASWETFNPAALVAPSDANYLVGTADSDLSAEIVVGTTPGGELGGTWSAPTVDATHSGSAHHNEDHTSRHERAGADEIDGDHLDIDFTPTNYTPATTPAEAANVDDLAAHLYGIDQALTGGWAVVLTDSAEYTRTGSTGYATLKSYTVSIPATDWIRLTFQTRFNNAAGSQNAAQLRFSVNSNLVAQSIPAGTANASGRASTFHQIIIPPRRTNYDSGGEYRSFGADSGQSNQSQAHNALITGGASGAILPIATVTALLFEGNITNSSSVVAIRDMIIETFTF